VYCGILWRNFIAKCCKKVDGLPKVSSEQSDSSHQTRTTIRQGSQNLPNDCVIGMRSVTREHSEWSVAPSTPILIESMKLCDSSYIIQPMLVPQMHSCVCVCVKTPSSTVKWFWSRGTWCAIRDHVQRSYLIVRDTEPDQLCVPAFWAFWTFDKLLQYGVSQHFRWLPVELPSTSRRTFVELSSNFRSTSDSILSTSGRFSGQFQHFPVSNFEHFRLVFQWRFSRPLLWRTTSWPT